MTELDLEVLKNGRALHRMLSYAADEAKAGQYTTCRYHILAALDALSADLEMRSEGRPEKAPEAG